MAIQMNWQHPLKQFLRADSHAWEHLQKWNLQTLRPHLFFHRQPRPQMNPHCHRLHPTQAQYHKWLRCSITLKLSERTPLLLFLLHWNRGQMGDQRTHSSLLLLHRPPMLLLQQLYQQTWMCSSLLFLLRLSSFLWLLNDVANELLMVVVDLHGHSWMTNYLISF